MTATTKPRGGPFWSGMFVHSDTETAGSEHVTCGSPVRSQYLRSVPPVTTDETAICTAESTAWVSYCPKCNVRVSPQKTLYETVAESYSRPL